MMLPVRIQMSINVADTSLQRKDMQLRVFLRRKMLYGSILKAMLQSRFAVMTPRLTNA